LYNFDVEAESEVSVELIISVFKRSKKVPFILPVVISLGKKKLKK
jgi:hypothetical protein